MKVLFVHERFGAFAGAEANAHAVATELRRRDHEVGLLHGPGTGRGEAEWRQTFSGGCYEIAANCVAEALAQFNPDLIFVHNLPGLEVLEALLESKVPAVRMVHDHALYCMRSYKYNVFSRRICTRSLSPYCLFPCGAFLKRDREGGFPLGWVSYTRKRKEIRLNQRFQRLLVATDYMKHELLRNGFRPAQIEIHAPVPPRANEAAPSTFSSRNLILYAGQITRGKGVDVLLEGLAKVRLTFECHLYGDGHYRSHCEHLSAQLGLTGKVHFRGFVPQDELQRQYQDCSVAVVSSVWPEPFGAVGLEAMRYRVPVVGFDAGGIKEWLIDGYNGCLVPWMDRRQFAVSVEALLLDKTRARQLGENGFRLLRERYDFSNYMDGLERLFERVAWTASCHFAT